MINQYGKKATVINLYGGPGCGKSTAAAYIFAKLKMVGVSCELVTEFAKDKTWENNSKALHCQPYVFGEQCYRMDRCADQVDVIITDSPLLLSALYNEDKDLEPEFTKVVIKKFNTFTNYNFFLKRWKKYCNIGRLQTEEQAIEIDNKIKSMLTSNKISFDEVEGRSDGFEEIIYRVRNLIGK